MKEARKKYFHARRRAIWAAGGATFVLLSLPLFFGEYYFGRDLTLYDSGVLCEIRARLAAADSLLLSPTLGNGAPLLADPQAQLLYPIRWLQLLFPLNLAPSIGPIIHLTLAAMAMAWLAQTFRLRPLPSFLLGVSFSLCGTCLDLIRHAAYIVGAAWLPTAWAAGREVISSRRHRCSENLLVLALTLCLLGGDPQSFGVSLGILFIECMLLRSKRPERFWGAVRAVAPAVLVALTLGLAAWVPAFAELHLSRRAGPRFSATESLHWSYGPGEWLATILPSVLTQPLAQPRDLYSFLNGPLTILPWNPTPYLGVATVLCAAVGALSPRARSAVVVMLVALAVSLGEHFVLLPTALHWIPPLRMFRYPEKYLVAMSMAAIVVAGFGAEAVARNRRRHLFLTLSFAVSVVFAAALVAIFTHQGEIDRAALGEALHVADPSLPTMATMLYRAVGWATAVVILGVFMTWRGRPISGLLLVMIACDIAVCAPLAVEVGPPFLDVPSPLAQVDQDRTPAGPVFCIDGRVGQSTLEENNEWGSALATRACAGYTLNACDQVSSAMSYSLFDTSMQDRLSDAMSQNHLGAARALGCTHLLTISDSTWDGLVERVPVAKLEATLPVKLVALTNFLPEAFVAVDPALSTNEPELLARIARSADLKDIQRQVDDPLRRLGGRALPSGDGVSIETVRWFSREKVSVSAIGTGGAIVGLRTSFRVGWHATQQGDELPVVRLSGNHVGAVADTASRGPIIFEYRLPNQLLAVLCGVAGLVGWVLLQRQKTPRSGTPGATPTSRILSGSTEI